MGKAHNWKRDAMATIWRVPDELWALIEPILAELDPPKATGHPRSDPRPILDAIIFRLRTGCQWNHLPRELGDDSTVHRCFQRWVRAGVFERIWAVVQHGSDELGGVDWEWQAADGLLRKARSGGTRWAPIPRTVPRTG
jgi:putative transposase